MNRISAILIAALSFHTANAHAQQTDADAPSAFEIPAGPLLNPAPAFAQWTITYSYGEETKSGGESTSSAASLTLPSQLEGSPRTIITTKTRDIIHEETVTINGNKQEDWQVHGNVYIKYPGRNFWSAYEYSDPALMADANLPKLTLPPSGFLGTEWINQQAYVGRMETDLGNCLIFVPKGRESLKGKLSKQTLDSLPTVAYVDPQTRLPIMIRAKNETRVFKFTQPPPDSMQALPSDLASEIKAGEAIRAKRNAAPQREY